MKLLELYSEYFANWLSEGLLINRDKISLLGIKPLFDRFYTHGWITKTWMIAKLPVEFNINITQKIRNEMFLACPGVKTVIQMYGSPVNVNVFSDVYRRQMHNAEKRYSSYKEVFDQLSDSEKMTGAVERDYRSGRRFTIDKETLKRIKEDYLSYRYVYDTASRGAGYSNVYYFIQASARTRKEMNEYRRNLKNLLAGDEIAFVEVHGTVTKYLDNFCPASFVHDSVSKFPTMLFSQEDTSALIPTKVKGLVNDRGILAAVDWESKLPFFIDFFNSGFAQVVLVLGKSGCGKTFFAFVFALCFAAIDVHWSATDIKGNEWTKLNAYVDLCEISMSGPGAKFVNTLRLDDVDCTKKDSIDFYETAIAGTTTLFEVATNLQENEGNVADLRSILNQAVVKLYNMNGVIKDNPDTFKYTKDFKYSQVLDIISTLSKSSSFTEQHKKLCNLIIVRCTPFFMNGQRYSDAFMNELTVGEIIDRPGVVYNFNKNTGETLDTLDNIRVYMAQFIDGKKAMIRKRQKLHSVAFYEELQRCDKLGNMLENISSNVTGSRSNNLTVFLLLNAISSFDNSAFRAIKSNITTKIVGKVTSDDEKELVEHFDCGGIQSFIRRIRENKKMEYNNCFAIDYDTGDRSGVALVKSVVPIEMQKAFATREVRGE